jgi:tryptophan halogenase
MSDTINGLHICIVGAGATGWIAYHKLKFHPRVSKITMISSPTIPKIGVGESTTLSFYRWLHKDLRLTPGEIKKFLVDIDAAVKYGVCYEGWGPRKFLHHFSNNDGSASNTLSKKYSLGMKPEKISHDESSVPLASLIYDNKVYVSDKSPWLDRSLQSYSYHFDANKFIQALHKLAEHDSKLNFISDNVIDSIYEDDIVKEVILQEGTHISADYFISCIGQTAFNQKIFHEEYISYSNYLLTNKALFAPLEYSDKVTQFHPYTVAKTMKHGWRWITPTRSRIGTGYVFSDNHISVDEAVNELRIDTGISNLNPFIVDFYPRRVKKVFKSNMCTLGMASGFLEPLDAPGLTLTSFTIDTLERYLNNFDVNIDLLNKKINDEFDYWCSFILHQYKTCYRSDTKFWVDHKAVESDFYNECINRYYNPYYSINVIPGTNVRSLRIQKEIKRKEFYNHSFMFYHTSSGKDIRWPKDSKLSYMPYIPLSTYDNNHLDEKRVITHREYFDRMVLEFQENA